MNEVTDLDSFERYVSQQIGQAEIVNQPLWDTVIYPCKGVHSLHCFEIPMGQCNKSDEQTNMMLPNQLPMSQAYFMESIALTVLDSSVIPSLLNSGMLQLIIGTKIYNKFAPLSALYALPEAMLMMAHKLGTGYGIISGMNFRVDLLWCNPPRLRRNVNIRVQLNGWLFRPVV